MFVQGFGEVGIGFVVEAQPQGEWLGVAIPLESWIFVLLQLHLVIWVVQKLKNNPC